MKPKLYIFLWYIVGIIIYIVLTWFGLEENLQWFLYFNSDHIMDTLLALALISFTKSWKIQYQLMVYGVVFSQVLAEISTIAGGITGKQQQGQWIEIFSHAFGITSFIAITIYIIENKSSIARTWAKFQQKLHGR